MQPLAERMRPQDLDSMIGQQHLIGKDSVLRKYLEQGKMSSLIFWWPPGTGKTTLAHIISQTLWLPFYSLSAVNAGVKDVREIIQRAEKFGEQTILFIDEIHRFNKGQQDALLHALEKGSIILIWATTENPSFEINNALLSRSQVYILKNLEQEDLIQLLHTTLKQDEILKQKSITLSETEALINISWWDARKLLNLLELVITTLWSQDPITITDQVVMDIAQQHISLYDKNGEQHYDIISAFIKSIRGSDPNGAVYRLARMLEWGEDIKFIARRLLISASEDIGNANPNALVLANSTFDAVQKIGNPEARIILSQCATYLASSPKSNASYNAINTALTTVQQTWDLSVPLHLRNAPTSFMKKQWYGEGYEYSHDYEESFSAQEYLPDHIAGTTFYQPGQNTKEVEIRKHLKSLRNNKYGY